MKHTFTALILVALTVIGCSQNTLFNSDTTGTLKIHLTDAPGDFDQVNITFSEIAVHLDDKWIDVRNRAITLNVLEWTGGRTTELSTADVPEGAYTQIRIKIDKAEIIKNGQKYDLQVPSGAKSGIKITTPFTVAKKETFNLIVDFDAQRSIVTTESTTNPNYQFTPTIRATPQHITGSITGAVTNATNAPIVYAIANGDTITSTRVETDGHFRLGFLPEGTYKVLIRNATGQSYESPSIGLIPKQDADMGIISLQ